jgi:hypothetical protein
MSNAIGIAIIGAIAFWTTIALTVRHNPVATPTLQNYNDNYLDGLRALWAREAACEAWRNRVCGTGATGRPARACDQ